MTIITNLTTYAASIPDHSRTFTANRRRNKMHTRSTREFEVEMTCVLTIVGHSGQTKRKLSLEQ